MRLLVRVTFALLLAFSLMACPFGRRRSAAGRLRRASPTAPGHIDGYDANGNPIAPKTPPAPMKMSSRAVLPFPPIGAVKAHPKANVAAIGCGQRVVNGKKIQVDCKTQDYGKVAGASKPIGIGRSVAASAHVPDVVDHRADNLEGPVRDQGAAGSCTANSLAAAVDHAVARWTGSASAVSVMEVWSRYHTPNMLCASGGNLHRPLGAESLWPYDESLAARWEQRGFGSCGAPLRAPEIDALTQAPVAELVDVTEIDPPSDTDAWVSALARGQDVWFAMVVGGAFHCDPSCPTLPGSQEAVIPDFDATLRGGGHALLATGYQKTPHGVYFLIKNSWGREWGNGGYAFLHESTLRRNLESAYVIEAHPSDPSHGRPRRNNDTATCDAGELPDSITAQCVPPCSDGSPRHNGTCADPSHCAQGYVNLHGSCVVAAPRTAGRNAQGVSWSCAPGGCAFTVPRGLGPCTQAECHTSCPAPMFNLKITSHGLGCTEG